MKVVLLCAFVACAFAQAAVVVEVTKPPIQNIQDLIDELNRVDNELKGSLQEQMDQAEQKKNELKDKVKGQVQQTVDDYSAQWSEKINEVDKLKADLQAQYAAETAAKTQELQDALTKAQEEFKTAQEAEKKKISEQWEATKQAYLDSMEAKKAEEQKKMKEVQKYLDEVNALFLEQQQAKDAAHQQRVSEIKAKATDFFDQVKTKKSALEAQAESLQQQYADYTAKKTELSGIVDNGLKMGAREILAESLEQKLDARLQKEMKEVVKDEVMQKLHPKAAPLIKDTANVLPKATLLDTLTGASAWETVAWVLLGLCILLSVALIAMIVYQVSQRNKYNKIDGSNSPNRRYSERAPIYPSNTAPPLHPYTEEKVDRPVPGPSQVIVSPSGETQQF